MRSEHAAMSLRSATFEAALQSEIAAVRSERLLLGFSRGCCRRRSDPSRMRSPETRFGIKPIGSWPHRFFANADTRARAVARDRQHPRKRPEKNPNGLPGRHKPNTRGGLATEERQKSPD